MAAACNWFAPELPPLDDRSPLVSVSDVWSAPTEAVLPTDLAPLPGGGFAVLDGYLGRILVYDAKHRLEAELGDEDTFGHPVRMAPVASGEGWWLSVPDRGAVLRIDSAGQLVEAVRVGAAERAGEDAFTPVAVHDLGDALVIGMRSGALVWLDAETGEVSRLVDRDVDGEVLGSIADVTVTPTGEVLAVDALGPKVHVLAVDGNAASWFGRMGLWVGYLSKPKSVAPGPGGTTLVADSALDLVEIFTRDGRPLGAAAKDGAPLRFGHPIAVVPADDSLNTFLVLDQETAMVWGFSIPEGAVAVAEEEAGVRHLRHPASEADVTKSIDEGYLCFECHDGFVNDDRFVWDTELDRHPEGIVPDRELPTFFPLDEQGRIVCSTCHSPHGVSTVEEVQDARTSGDVHEMVRHAPGGEMFTRMSRDDSALCVGCHEDAAHERAVDELDVGGRTHPVGPELIEALEERADTGEGGDLGLPPGTTRAGLSRSADQGEVCMACHRESGDPARNHPLGTDLGRDFRVPRKTADLPMTRRGHTCRTCHDLVGGIGDHMIRVPLDGGLLCISCHEPEKGSGPHGSKELGEPVPCVGCHKVHGGNPKARLLRTVGSATKRDPQGCLHCHGADGRFAQVGVRPGTLGHPVAVEDLSCVKCHDEHQPDLDLPSCRSCHEEEGVEEDRGGHGSAECLDCHPMHRASPRYLATNIGLNPVSRRCLGCHAPGTDGSEVHVTLYEHPLPIFKPDGTRWSPLGKLPLFDSSGNRVISGQNGELTCTSCHLVHGPDAEKPGDNLRIPGWQDACSACHGADALLMYRYFHEPDRRDGLGTVQ
jgi:hypothetical protein